jgi:hypothetical protein
MNISTGFTDNIQIQTHNNNADTISSTPSSLSDYISGEADNSSDSKGSIPYTLKSVENYLSLSKVTFFYLFVKIFNILYNIYLKIYIHKHKHF